MAEKGIVYLVGAGPGDPELLTLKAARLIAEADVVVFDRLVGEKIMDMIPESAQRIDVGKNVGDHPVPQSEINKILLREALEGKKVVRLKGGDPFVFGRGGEELELLAENNVEFQVVPGITSSISAPAYGGIPVTHRDFCSSLHIITGHAKAGAELTIDFEALVRLKGTLIFMMSVGTVGMIAKGLIAAGMEKDMPCAIIENGTRPEQRKFVADLETIEKVASENQVKSPAVIMVGKVCSLSDSFDWFGKLPLKGKRILVTQPEKKASRLDEGLRRLGAYTRLYPTIRTEYIRPINPQLEDKNVLVFTSVEGVNSFFDWLKETGQDTEILSTKRFACVGPTTAGALEERGIKCDFMPREYYGKDLGEEMVSTGFVGRTSKVLLLRADIGSEDILSVFEKAGIWYEDYPVYETKYIEQTEPVRPEDWDCITFTSKSCVEGFVRTQSKAGAGEADFAGIKAVCIGEKTAEIARGYGFETIVSQEATIEKMVEKIIEEARNE